MDLLWLVVLLPIVFCLLVVVYITGGWFGLGVVAVAVAFNKLIAMNNDTSAER